MIKYYIKGDDVIVIAEDWSANFDPNSNSEYSTDYSAWLEAGNIPEQWETE